MFKIRFRKKGVNAGLKILLLTNAPMLLAAAMLGPIYALFVENIGGDLLDASIAGTLFAFAAGCIMIISGKLSDKITYKEYLVSAGYLLAGIGYILFAYATTVIHIFLIQVILGIAEAVRTPAFDALYSTHLDRHKEASEWSLWESMYYFTTAAGALVGGLIVTHYSFNLLFIVMGISCFIGSFGILLLKKKL